MILYMCFKNEKLVAFTTISECVFTINRSFGIGHKLICNTLSYKDFDFRNSNILVMIMYMT
jgi:hypothetical protein